jgi:hypothetical protein
MQDPREPFGCRAGRTVPLSRSAPHPFRRVHLVVAACAFVGLAYLLAACSTAPKIVNTWQDPAYKGPAFKKVMVAGLTEKETSRRVFEDTFCAILREDGVEAVPSYQLLKEHRGYEREVIERVVSEGGFDAIITARVVGVDRETSYSSGYTMAYPSTAYYHDFYGFYNSSWQLYAAPTHAYTYDVVRVETNVYETQKWDLVWTGMTETVDPGEIQHESQKLAQVIMSELKARGLI